MYLCHGGRWEFGINKYIYIYIPNSSLLAVQRLFPSTKKWHRKEKNLFFFFFSRSRSAELTIRYPKTYNWATLHIWLLFYSLSTSFYHLAGWKYSAQSNSSLFRLTDRLSVIVLTMAFPLPSFPRHWQPLAGYIGCDLHVMSHNEFI